jgi:hypothetical protein
MLNIIQNSWVRFDPTTMENSLLVVQSACEEVKKAECEVVFPESKLPVG